MAKNNSYKEFDNEKNSCGSKIPKRSLVPSILKENVIAKQKLFDIVYFPEDFNF